MYLPEKCIGCATCTMICPRDDLVIGSVGAITVRKTAILPDMKKKLTVPTPRPMLTSTIITDEEACLGCGNCVIACPVNAFSDPYLVAGHLNELDRKSLL